MNYEDEIWRPVENFPNYEVSNYGRIASLNFCNRAGRRKLLIPIYNKKGYVFVSLCNCGKIKKMSVHRLVAMTFIPNPNNYPVVNHKDENPSNNCVENLEWCTVQYNTTYNDAHIKRGFKCRGANNPLYGKKKTEEERRRMSEYLKGVKRRPECKIIFRIARTKGSRIHQIDKQGNIIAIYLSSIEAYEQTGIASRNIRLCCQGKQKTAGGYRWVRVKVAP